MYQGAKSRPELGGESDLGLLEAPQATLRSGEKQ